MADEHSEILQRLAVLETKQDYQVEILESLRDLPTICAGRGIQVQLLTDANLDSRMTIMENDVKWANRIAKAALGFTAAILSHKVYGPVLLSLQKLFS